ncbi:MAG: helix-turn-helix domain-containing protein [Acidobacteriaceae bacterium]
MGHFGEELRRERVARGIELETISGTTKIITRYLTALEDEQFDALPGGILSKGIVRGYARAVGLDEVAWVERFLAASQPQGSTGSEDGWVAFVSNVGRSRARSNNRPEMRLRWTGVLMLLLVLAGFGWFVWRYVNGHVNASAAERPAVTSAAVAGPVGDAAR